MIAYSVSLFTVAVIFLILGILIYRGNTGIIHDYHQTNVKASDKKKYGRSFAKAMFGISLTLFVSGGIALFGESKVFLLSSIAVLSCGLICSIIWIVRVQNKYNGGIFR